MKFPLSISDMGLWLAAMSLILLITSELISSSSYSRDIIIDKTIFRQIALFLGMGFIVTVILRFFNTL